ncbi:recombinase family protein [Vibrio alginolyticus]
MVQVNQDMKHIYSRVSTLDQNVEQQTKLLIEQYGDDCRVWEDKTSGKNADREQFQAMKAHLRSKDTVIVYDISRLGRNVLDVLEFCESMEVMKVKVVVHALGQVDVTFSTGKLVLTTLAAVAEMQRTEMLEKQAIGIQRAKEEGKYKGKQVSQASWNEYNQVVELIGLGMSANKALATTGMNRSKFYRLHKMKQD